MNRRTSSRRDRGSILPIVFVIVVVLGAVVVAIASYATSTLRYGQVVEGRADRLSAAQAATNDAIEQLALKRAFSLCATAAGGAGVSHVFPEPINGATVTVNCSLVNGALPNNEGFALVITGEGVNSGTNTLQIDNGGTPEITGPVFVHDPRRIDLQKALTIKEGDLWYEDTATTATFEDAGVPGGTCDVDNGAADVEFDRVVFQNAYRIDNLSFLPTLRGLYCVNRAWGSLFDPPTLATIPTSAPTSGYDPLPDASGCKVFTEGHYTSAPVLGDNNYFMSGVYHFDNVGMVEFNLKSVATFGNSQMQGFPAITNDKCDVVRSTDSVAGAVLYTSGDTQFLANKNQSGMEISGRMLGSTRVALHVLSTTLDPNSEPLVKSENGNKREFTFNGQVWAPDSFLSFETIPEKKNAILRGGAVVARLLGMVSGAGDDNFKIEVASTSGSGQLQLDAVAVDAQGSTTVRTIADYRPSNGDIATRSRRVIWN